MISPTEPSRPSIVLDTNVVLDWLVFANPGCVALQASIAAGNVRWVATAAMRDELAHVLARGALDAWRPDMPVLWEHWQRHCVELAQPAPGDPTMRPRCTDPDDQKFIDLAVACGARWLLSRDRAVLKLAARLGKLGTEVCTPSSWDPHRTAAE